MEVSIADDEIKGFTFEGMRGEGDLNPTYIAKIAVFSTALVECPIPQLGGRKSSMFC